MMAWFDKKDKKAPNETKETSAEEKQTEREVEAQDEKGAKSRADDRDEEDKATKAAKDDKAPDKDGPDADDEDAPKEKKLKKAFSLIPKHYPCPNCGGGDKFKEYTDRGVRFFKCGYCGGEFREQSVLDDMESLENTIRDAIAQADFSKLSKYRRRLYDALTDPRDFDRGEIEEACRDIQTIKPGDVMADFYRQVATRNDEIAPIRKLLRDENDRLLGQRGHLDTLIAFMTKPAVFHREYQHDLQSLVERAYKNTDPDRFEDFNRAIEKAVQAVDEGVFDPTKRRDVYVACADTDTDRAMQLVEHLESVQQLSCFIACRNISKGRSVEEAIKDRRQAIRACTVFVLVGTRDSCSPGSDFYKQERPFIMDVDRAAAKAEDAAYEDEEYVKIPLRFKKPRLEYRPMGEVYGAVRNANMTEFFSGFETVSMDNSGPVVTSLLMKTAEQIKKIIDDKKKRSIIRCCQGCGRRLEMGEAPCCAPFAVMEFDALDDYRHYREDVKRRKEEEERETRAQEARERREAERRLERLMMDNAAARNAAEEYKKRLESSRVVSDFSNATTEAQYREKIDAAFRTFMGGDFRGASVRAEEILHSLPDHLPMQFITAFFSTFVNSTGGDRAMQQFFAAAHGKTLLKDDVRLMKNMLLLAGPRLRDFEADALEVLMFSEGGVAGSVAFADRFCPKLIAARKNTAYLNERLIMLYGLLVEAGAAALCGALLDSIRQNPDSPYVQNSFHLTQKCGRYYDEYIQPIGRIVMGIKNPTLLAQCRSRYVQEESAYLVRMQNG